MRGAGKHHLVFDARATRLSRAEAERAVIGGLGAYLKFYKSIRVIGVDAAGEVFDFTEQGGT